MKVKLKPLAQQTIVITGASSGIGLCTARLAAERGARVVLAARNERDLRLAVDEITSHGGEAIHVAADVADEEQVARVADTAIERFGGFDTWVNDASVAIYGRLDEIPMEDKRRLFDVNFWGVINGTKHALRHLRVHGGALINIGSITSDAALPLLGIYSASKAAVKAYTDVLRMELEEEGAPVSVSLVKPASIDTPFFQKARNYMEHEPRPAPPVYDPKVVAEAILTCAERPVREVFVGGGAKMMSSMRRLSNTATEKVMEKTLFDAQQYDERATERRTDNLYAHVEHDGGERGDFPGHVMKSSLYTTAALHPVKTALAAAGLGAVLVLGMRNRL